MEKIEIGTIIEINIPNEEKPVKAVVLDKESTDGGDYWTRYTYFMYAKNQLFKMSNEVHWGVHENMVTGEMEDYYRYSPWIKYQLIVGYCNIPNIEDI